MPQDMGAHQEKPLTVTTWGFATGTGWGHKRENITNSVEVSMRSRTRLFRHAGSICWRATLYLVGLDAAKKRRNIDVEPCPICRRIIVNAGIKKVVVGEDNGKHRTYLVEKWVRNNIKEFRKEKGLLIPVRPPLSLNNHFDKERQDQLIARFSLSDAVVVQTTTFENCKQTVGRAAARFFDINVKSRSSVALSCGDTILALLESLPYQSRRRLIIHQLSIEGDPATIHQAPATLVGLLRGKSSPESQVYGLQLPPIDLSPLSIQLREGLLQSPFLANLKRKALRSRYIFFGVGSVNINSANFWAVAQAATGGEFQHYVEMMGIVGEINNQVFDESGTDCTDRVPGLAKHLVNVLSLNDLRSMACDFPKHKVVMVASGPEKTRAMRVALEAGYANVLITGRDDVDRLLADG